MLLKNDTDYIVICVDLTNPDALNKINGLIKASRKYANTKSKLILAGTKSDLIGERKITDEQLQQFIHDYNWKNIGELPFQQEFAVTSINDQVGDEKSGVSRLLNFVTDDALTNKAKSSKKPASEEIGTNNLTNKGEAKKDPHINFLKQRAIELRVKEIAEAEINLSVNLKSYLGQKSRWYGGAPENVGKLQKILGNKRTNPSYKEIYRLFNELSENYGDEVRFKDLKGAIKLRVIKLICDAYQAENNLPVSDNLVNQLIINNSYRGLRSLLNDIKTYLTVEDVKDMLLFAVENKRLISLDAILECFGEFGSPNVEYNILDKALNEWKLLIFPPYNDEKLNDERLQSLVRHYYPRGGIDFLKKQIKDCKFSNYHRVEAAIDKEVSMLREHAQEEYARTAKTLNANMKNFMDVHLKAIGSSSSSYATLPEGLSQENVRAINRALNGSDTYENTKILLEQFRNLRNNNFDCGRIVNALELKLENMKMPEIKNRIEASINLLNESKFSGFDILIDRIASQMSNMENMSNLNKYDLIVDVLIEKYLEPENKKITTNVITGIMSNDCDRGKLLSSLQSKHTELKASGNTDLMENFLGALPPKAHEELISSEASPEAASSHTSPPRP